MPDKQISLQIDTGVTGRESIVGLADDLENVAKVLEGEVSTEARTAAARLRELAQQDAAITTFTKLDAQAKSSAASLRLAETEAKNYARQITAMGPPTEKEVAALRQLNAAADSARSTFDQQKQALSEAQAELQRFGVAGRNAQQAQQRLRQEVEQVRDSVLTLVPAHQSAAAGAQNAAASMVRSHRQIGDGVESISKQLDRLQKFYIGLQSLQGMKNLAFDLAETADQANNLQGRMKLVTGEGENFKRSWEGVTEVALRTHSALEGTGVLFSRIAQAGLDAGLSAQKASQQSLGLTETINQTIQISGSSAEASSAAITGPATISLLDAAEQLLVTLTLTQPCGQIVDGSLLLTQAIASGDMILASGQAAIGVWATSDGQLIGRGQVTDEAGAGHFKLLGSTGTQLYAGGKAILGETRID
ncbi:hypothetical protein COAQ111491_20080 [Comamonas aquatilis]|uniref:tape measure protein n=1 Tax=Comamonas aquatilis TaxID=1778406 RepID=UPI0039F0CD79